MCSFGMRGRFIVRRGGIVCIMMGRGGGGFGSVLLIVRWGLEGRSGL